MVRTLTREQMVSRIGAPAAGLLLVDLTPRESYIRAHLNGAVHRTEHELVFETDRHCPDRSAEIILYAASPGSASLWRCAHHLEAMGYRNVAVYEAGEDAWLAAALPEVGATAGSSVARAGHDAAYSPWRKRPG
jgi:rhodanese-related sulfurtransferase